MTYTYVQMTVSQGTFDEVKQRLLDAGYDQALHDGGATLDMHGIALVAIPQHAIAAGQLEVGNDGRDVVINHPDLMPDANGVGHIVFSAAQARNLARLLMKNAAEIDRPRG